MLLRHRADINITLHSDSIPSTSDGPHDAGLDDMATLRLASPGGRVDPRPVGVPPPTLTPPLMPVTPPLMPVLSIVLALVLLPEMSTAVLTTSAPTMGPTPTLARCGFFQQLNGQFSVAAVADPPPWAAHYFYYDLFNCTSRLGYRESFLAGCDNSACDINRAYDVRRGESTPNGQGGEQPMFRKTNWCSYCRGCFSWVVRYNATTDQEGEWQIGFHNYGSFVPVIVGASSFDACPSEVATWTIWYADGSGYHPVESVSVTCVDARDSSQLSENRGRGKYDAVPLFFSWSCFWGSALPVASAESTRMSPTPTPDLSCCHRAVVPCCSSLSNDFGPDQATIATADPCANLLGPN